MFKKVLKSFGSIGNLVGNDSTGLDDAVEFPQVNQSYQVQTKFHKENDVKEYICNCCNTNKISIETEIFKDGDDPVTSPTMTIKNGKLVEEVALCDDCLSGCKTEADYQSKWIVGKVNQLSALVESFNETKTALGEKIKTLESEANEKMRAIQKEAVDSIQQVQASITEIEGQIRRTNKTILEFKEIYAQKNTDARYAQEM